MILFQANLFEMAAFSEDEISDSVVEKLSLSESETIEEVEPEAIENESEPKTVIYCPVCSLPPEFW